MTPAPQLAPEAVSPELKEHLPTLPPLFLPPPFTPSHPAFSYLSSIANSESQAIRDAAEEYLARVTQEKLAEIKAHETRLRQQTESLWSQFRQGLERFGGDKRNHLNHGRKEGAKWNGQGEGSPSPGAFVAVNDFVPSPALHQRLNGGDLTPKASALSASLVNSGFHYPRERRTQDSSTSPPPTILSNPSETGTSPATASSPTLTNFIELDQTNDILEPFKRDMSDSKDLATSLLVLNLEAEMERRRRAARLETVPESSAQGAKRPDTPVAEATQPNEDITKATNGIDRNLTQSPQPNAASEAELTNPKAKKGKRRVTFDVQPDVVTIKRDVTKEQEANRLEARANGKSEGLHHSLGRNGVARVLTFPSQFRFSILRTTSIATPPRRRRRRCRFSSPPKHHAETPINAHVHLAARDLAYLNHSPLCVLYVSPPLPPPDSLHLRILQSPYRQKNPVLTPSLARPSPSRPTTASNPTKMMRC